MAMTLPIAIPSTASPASSDDASILPHTPVSPRNQLLPLPLPDQSKSIPPQLSGPTQMKRKPSRRANTAERRATHNAVERQRRETLNGRFLDLAALLPNLSQIRRPSKSSIVNSSIAHINASRRHRVLASRELRLLKLESDTIRRELNEWHDRASLPRIDEPIRGEGFGMVLSGELEVLAGILDEEEENGGQGFDGYDDGEDDFGGMMGNPMDELDDSRNPMVQNLTMLNNPSPFAHNSSNNHLAHMINRPIQGPMIVSAPPAVSFENPAMSSLYEPNLHHGSQFPNAPYLQQQSAVMNQGEMEKVAVWNAQLYSALASGAPPQQLLQAQRSLFTPPATSHGLPAATATPNSTSGVTPQPSSNPFADPGQSFLVNLQRQQQMTAMQQQPLGHMYGSPDADDSSSVGSGRSQRERSGSLSGSASGYGSPHGSSPIAYDMPMPPQPPLVNGGGDYGVPRRMSTGWAHETDGMGLMKSNLVPSIAVGGGGNGAGFAMMM